MEVPEGPGHPLGPPLRAEEPLQYSHVEERGAEDALGGGGMTAGVRGEGKGGLGGEKELGGVVVEGELEGEAAVCAHTWWAAKSTNR